MLEAGVRRVLEVDVRRVLEVYVERRLLPAISPNNLQTAYSLDP